MPPFRLRALTLALPVLLTACQADGPDDTDAADTDVVAHDPTWRDTLDLCWTDLSCPRAFVISHGGDWTVDDYPYDSENAFHRAQEKGADGIKTDVHVTKDHVAVVAHSSPIEPWESFDCGGQRIEDMTADEVTQCHIAPSTTQTFQRLDTVLEWARGKVVLMLTVKEPVDFPRAIETVIEHDALDYVFLETGIGDLRDAIPVSPDWERAWYNVQVDSPADLDTLLTSLQTPRTTFCEIGVDYQETHNAEMADLIAQRVHPAGMRAFVSTIHLPSVDQHRAMWDAGFDILMTYNLDNAITARDLVNAERGVGAE